MRFQGQRKNYRTKCFCFRLLQLGSCKGILQTKKKVKLTGKFFYISTLNNKLDFSLNVIQDALSLLLHKQFLFKTICCVSHYLST